MRAHKWMVLLGIMLLLFFGLGSATAQDSSPEEPQATVGPNFTYQGYLEDNNLPANGEYDFEVKLYDAVSAGTQVGSTASLEDVDVVKGYFTVQPDFVNYFIYIYTGQALWLEIAVRPGASSGSYTILTPRQPLTATPYALSLVPGATIDVDYNYGSRGIINVANRSIGNNTFGVYARSYSTLSGGGVLGVNHSTTGNGFGVWGSAQGDAAMGVKGDVTSATGVTYGVYGKASSSSGYGVFGEAPTFGVYGSATASTAYAYGVYGITTSTSGRGVFGWAGATTGASRGVYGRVDSASGFGGDFYNSDGGVALRIESETTTGDVLRLYGANSIDMEFRVTGNGNVYADGVFTGGGADLAEMLPAVEGLQPGEILVIGLDGKLARSTQAYQASVVGVYSTQPGFLGGAGDDTELTGKIPLAVVGVVPVKVSAENGAIQPGDMLVASATPGYAMRGEGVELCFGRTIGKALEALDSGTGVILVLVMLQ